MGLDDIIAKTNKEITGSRTKNRLTVQISYAMQLIIDFYTTDFLILMDYIEDVAVICNPAQPSAIHLYQVKTKTSDKQYMLSAVIKDNWFQKLYANAQKYESYLGSATVVCNTDIIASQTTVFPNAKTALDDATIQSNVKKIRSAIATDQAIDESEVDLSKFFFIRSTLSTNGHKDEAEYQFDNFLLGQEVSLQVATAKSIYALLYDELDKKFNQEISENCTNVQEIFEAKGLDGKHIKELISCGLSIQIPTLEKIYSEFRIDSVSEKRKFTSQYTQVKMDMYSNMSIFIQLKRLLLGFIEESISNDIDDMTGLLLAVYQRAIENELISNVYSNEHYLKIMIMVLIYKYCYGGEET